MNRIVVFDTWLNGLRFVDFLPIKYTNNQWIFLHTSSLFGRGNDESKWSGETRDLKEWGYNITKALQALRPDKVLVISIHNYEQRILINVCNRLGIPVDFYPHGIRVKEKIVARGNRSYRDYLNRFVVHLFWLTKLLNANSDIYSLSLRLGILSSILSNYNGFKNGQIQLLPIQIRRTALNSSDQKEYFINDWNLLGSEYFVTNNVKNLFDAKACEPSATPRECVLFIGQPLYGGAKNYTRYFEELARVIKNKVGGRLIFRPHPSQQASFDSLPSDIFEVSTESINTLMGKVKLVVGVNSAMLYLAELLHIPRCIFSGVDKIDFPDLLSTDLVLHDTKRIEARVDEWCDDLLNTWSYESNNIEKYWSNWQSFIGE